MYETPIPLYIWSEDGFVFYMEETDDIPSDLDLNLYSFDANQMINHHIENMSQGGYKIIIGRPERIKDNWQLQQYLENHKGTYNGT